MPINIYKQAVRSLFIGSSAGSKRGSDIAAPAKFKGQLAASLLPIIKLWVQVSTGLATLAKCKCRPLTRYLYKDLGMRKGNQPTRR